jgi:hypothetical protein
MSAPRVKKLECVLLHENWKREACDFTQLRQGDIHVLNEALNIKLFNMGREQAAGSFRIDLVAEGEAKCPKT